MDFFKKLLARPDVAKFLRFCVTGALNTGVDLLIFTVLAQFFGVNPYLSQIISYSGGMTNSYILNRSWTFQSKDRFFGKELLRFIPFNLLVMGGSLVVFYCFNSLLGLHMLIAKLFTVGFTMVFGFLLNRFFVFGK